MTRTDNKYDLQLWRRIAWEDDKNAAFDELFDRYYVPLCRFAEFWLRDRTSAEEVVLDIFTHLWQHAAELHITNSVSIPPYQFYHPGSADHVENNFLQCADFNERTEGNKIRDQNHFDGNIK